MTAVAARWGSALIQNLMKNPKKRAILLATALVLISVVADQITKVQAQRFLMVWSHETDSTLYQGSRRGVLQLGDDLLANQKRPCLSLSLNYVRNPGAAWGSFAKMAPPVRKVLFHTLTVVAVGVIGYFLWVTPMANLFARYGLYCVLAGAVGNFIDRLRMGYVIDWVDIRWRVFGWRYSFPAFNIADVCISVGVALLIYDLLILEPRRQQQQTPPSPNPVPPTELEGK